VGSGLGIVGVDRVEKRLERHRGEARDEVRRILTSC
jgi:hypothetical protein